MAELFKSARYQHMVECDLLGPPIPPRRRRTYAEIENEKQKEREMFSTLAKDIVPKDQDYVTGQHLFYELLSHPVVVTNSCSAEKAWRKLRKDFLPQLGWELQPNPASKTGRYKTADGKFEVFKKTSVPKLSRQKLKQIGVL